MVLKVIRSTAFVDYPRFIFPTIACFASFFSLLSSEAFISISLLLAILLLYGPIISRKSGQVSLDVFILGLAIAIGRSAAWLVPALDALSDTAVASIVYLFILSSVPAFTAIFCVLIYTRLRTRHESSYILEMFLFPSLWSSTWCLTSTIIPVGRFAAWTPAIESGSYRWMLPVLGSVSTDWLIGCYAVFISRIVELWFIGARDDDDEDELLASTQSPYKSLRANQTASSTSILLLGLLLSALAVPSFFVGTVPLGGLPSNTTTLALGCVLPPSYRHKPHYAPTLDDFLKETKRLVSFAPTGIVIWPEAAVTFENENERDAAFKRVQTEVHAPLYVGVSYIEAYKDETGNKVVRRNAFALLSNSSSVPHLVYSKRYLVPIAESFSLRASRDPPTIFELPLVPPKGITKPEWGNATRPVPVTASICNDFSSLRPFGDLTQRPAVILAPAKTWQPQVGQVMWNLAKQRAEELGSVILWCDGGREGVSGLTGKGFNQVLQVGAQGSWTHHVALEHPFPTQPTLYARVGPWWTFITLFCLWTGTLLPWWMISPIYGRAATAFTAARKRVTARRTREVPTGDLLG